MATYMIGSTTVEAFSTTVEAFQMSEITESNGVGLPDWLTSLLATTLSNIGVDGAYEFLNQYGKVNLAKSDYIVRFDDGSFLNEIPPIVGMPYASFAAIATKVTEQE